MGRLIPSARLLSVPFASELPSLLQACNQPNTADVGILSETIHSRIVFSIRSCIVDFKTQRTQPRIAMTQTSKPSNQQVRNWMQQRQVDRTPPPAPEEIRTQLGWRLIEAEREAKQPR
jgi:hypothetical protein